VGSAESEWVEKPAMSSTDEFDYEFDKLSDEQMKITMNRRQFFEKFVNEYQVQNARSEGKPVYKLSALRDLLDEQIAQVIPAIVPGCQISESDGFIWGQPPSSSEPIKLFPIATPAYTAFDFFGCMNPLGVIAVQVARTTGLELTQTFAYVRGLFLYLVKLGVCVPE
jgi:hypothetical protein